MKINYKVINPAPVKKKKRRSSSKKRTAKNTGVKKLNPGKGPNMAAKKSAGKKRGVKRKTASHSSARTGGKPKTTIIRVNNPSGKKKTYRRRRNPETPSMDPLKANNALQYGAGAAAGVFVPTVVANMLGFQGNAKYLTQLGVGVAGFIVGRKMGVPKAGLAFLISSVAIAMYEFSQDYGIMQGAHTLLGVQFTPPKLMGMVPRLNGMIPNRMSGMVTYNQRSAINGNVSSSGYDN